MRLGATLEEWNHFDSSLGLREDLLPVVCNPKAEISPLSSLKTLGKAPSEYNHEGKVRSFPGWTKHISGLGDIMEWMQQPDYGICVITRLVRGLDIDVPEGVKAEAIVAAVDDALGYGLPMRFRKDSGKVLLAFKLVGDLPKETLKVDGGIIEFLATGEQFVACGTHQKGARIEWEEGLPAEFPELTLDEFRRLQEVIRAGFALPGETWKVSGEARKKEKRIDRPDPVADFLRGANYVLAEDATGKLTIECPWACDHSPGSGTEAVWFLAGTNGYRTGAFKCLHAHCEDKKTADFLKAVEYVPAFECYYDKVKKEFLIQDGKGGWMAQNDRQMNRNLRKLGISPKIKPESMTSAQEDFLMVIERTRFVRYAAPLAGRDAGYYEENGLPFLVTESPTIIDPEPGEWPIIRALVWGLLFNSERESIGQMQLDTFFGWLQTGARALRDGRPQHAQALALAGKKDCGKSLLQHIITLSLGCRAAKAALFMSGGSPFNAELFEAEHLMLEDEYMSTRITDRLKLGSSIKNLTVSTNVQSCHDKGRKAVNIRPWWRVSISLNDDPESLRVLPPLNDDIDDKIILLRGSRFSMPMATETSEEQEAFRQVIRGEMPAFLHWLLNEFEIPEHCKSRRFVVERFQHPELVAELSKLAPESHLLSMIDTVLFPEGCTEFVWRGKADALRELLCRDHRTAHDASRLLDYPDSAGTYLGRLARSAPERVIKYRDTANKEWTIRKLITLADL